MFTVYMGLPELGGASSDLNPWPCLLQEFTKGGHGKGGHGLEAFYQAVNVMTAYGRGRLLGDAEGHRRFKE